MSLSPRSSSRARLLRRAVLLAAVGGVAVWALQRNSTGDLPPPDAPLDLMTTELLKAAERADMCTTTTAVGVGLRGEYFDKASLKGTASLVRVDEVVDFDAGIKFPSGTSGRPVASIRWSGWLKAPISGFYRFHADAPGMRVVVGQQVVAGVGAPNDEKVELAAGRFYPVEVVVDALADSDTRIRLEWTAPHGARYVVPKALLHLPTPTETTTTPKA